MKIGSLVVCINDNWDKIYIQKLTSLGVIFPKMNKIYTVREINSSPDCILLEEIVNPIIKYRDVTIEQDFHISRFRELDTPTSISIEEIITQHA